MELLWGSRSEEQAKASLRQLLSELRRLFRNYGDVPIEADRTRVFLQRECVVVDVERIEALAGSDASQDRYQVISLYDGDFLAGLHINERSFQEWKEIEQTRLRELYRGTLSVLLEELDQNERDEAIVDTAARLLAIDGAAEEAHRSLMRLYHRNGKQSLALRQYETCKQKLLRDYGVSPSEETVRLHNAIRVGNVRPATANPTGSRQTQARVPIAQSMHSSLGASLAVLPFRMVADEGGEAEKSSLLAEEVIDAAARFKWFRVLPRHKSFDMPLGEMDLPAIAESIGARYLLDGRLRRTESEFVLSVELIDGTASQIVWSEQISSPASKTFPFQDGITAKVASRLDVRLRVNEIKRAFLVEDSDLSAYECTLLALSNMYELTKGSFANAERYFDRAVALKPDHSSIYTFWCLWKMWSMGQGWSADSQEEKMNAAQLAREAIRRDPDDALALAMSGHLEAYWFHNFDQAQRQFERSLTLNPYSSFAWMLSSATCSYCGNPDEALRRLAYSRELCAVESHLEFMFDTAHCIAYLFGRDFERALEWGYKTVRENPGFTNGYKLLLVALGNLGHDWECARYFRQLLEIEPDFQVAEFLKQYPFSRAEDRAIYLRGLTKAIAAAERAE
jgi:DNA-binding SARP family transcriptional activator